MKSDNTNFAPKKISIAAIFANQHPVINSWIMLSAIAIVALYAITFTSI